MYDIFEQFQRKNYETGQHIKIIWMPSLKQAINLSFIKIIIRRRRIKQSKIIFENMLWKLLEIFWKSMAAKQNLFL